MHPSQPRGIALKEAVGFNRSISIQCGLASFPPFRTVPDYPVGQCAFETDVVAGLLRFDPLMSEDFLPFRLELAVEGRISEQVVR